MHPGARVARRAPMRVSVPIRAFIYFAARREMVVEIRPAAVSLATAGVRPATFKQVISGSALKTSNEVRRCGPVWRGSRTLRLIANAGFRHHPAFGARCTGGSVTTGNARHTTATQRMCACLLVCFVSLSGCQSTQFATDRAARAAIDTPQRFMVGLPASSQTSAPKAGDGCRNPMVDPRDETRITLVRSKNDRGDYEVTDARYGVRRGELLRLECSTGRVIGIVAR